MNENAKDFLFSVIIPVYNVEDYLEETVSSVLNQTIGFLDNIELILVDDGSTDASGAMCDVYAEAFPDNVKVLHQENQGVAAARNAGLGLATGRFVNLLDSDDLWNEDAFQLAYEFSEEHPEIGLISGRIMYFELWNGPHALDVKFKRTRIVNIFSNWDFPQLSSSTVFIKREAIGDLRYKPLKIAEDFLFISEVILKLGTYAVIRECVYNYRRRKTSSSALGNYQSNKNYYTDCLESCKGVFALSRRYYGYVIPYAQFAVMYDLQWKINSADTGVLSPEEKSAYKDQVVGFLKQIDDKIILRQHNLNNFWKLYVLSLKHECTLRDIQKKLALTAKGAKWGNCNLTARDAKLSVCIETIEKTDGNVVLTGYLNTVFPAARVALLCNWGEESFEAVLTERHDKAFNSFFDRAIPGNPGFRVKLPSGHDRTLSCMLIIDGARRSVPVVYGYFACLSSAIPDNYGLLDGSVLRLMPNGRIRYREHPRKRYIAKREAIAGSKIIKKEKLHGVGIALNRASAVARYLLPSDTRIWLLSDRLMMGGDNAEALFRYICESKPKGVRAYFVLSEKSPDIERIKKIGPVVTIESKQYSKLFMQAEFVISSSFDTHVFRHFNEDEDYYKGLYSRKFVFLQHGVTKDDMSLVLGKPKKNICCFITATQAEYDSIVGGKYGYDESTVLLSGFPRHDQLRSTKRSPGKNIFVAPTWRNNLVDGFDSVTNKAIIDPDAFISSDYYLAYSRLMNDEKLLSFLRDAGYKIRFAIHPGFIEFADSFTGNDVVEIIHECNYSEEFLNAAIMITDYSSVAFDFAILKRPILYYQFDQDEFFGSHIYEQGYFDYVRDGFGPVIKEEEALVQAIIDCVDNGCLMDEEYLARAEDTFFVPPEGQSSSSIVCSHLLSLH